MGRAPCCDKANVKRGPWSPEEDETLRNYVQNCGTGGNWIALPQKAGLKRCGKSCRLRWLNYLRPDIKHGGFTEEEDNIIVSLYGKIGSRWSVIAANLAGRTDNDVKNHWNTKLKKKFFGGAGNKMNNRAHHHRRRQIQLSNTTFNVPTTDYNDNPTTTAAAAAASHSHHAHFSSLPPDYYNSTHMSYPYLPTFSSLLSQTSTPSAALLFLPALPSNPSCSDPYPHFTHQHSLQTSDLGVHDQQKGSAEANLEASGTTNLSAAGSPSSLITMEQNGTSQYGNYGPLSAGRTAEEEFLLADFGFGGGFPFPFPYDHLSFSSMVESSCNYDDLDDARAVVDIKPAPQAAAADHHHHHQGLSSQSSSTSHAAAANFY